MIDAGKEVVDFRKAHGLSQKKLAELMGVTHLTIMRWEKRIRLDAVIGRAFRDLEREIGGTPAPSSPTYISGRIVIPHEEEMILKKQAGRDWDEIKYGNPGDEREMAWVGLLKYAARVHGGNYKAYYESELKRYGCEDDEVFEWS